MSQQPPEIYDAEPVSDEQKRLVTLFNDIESKQLDFLDAAGKSIVERTAALLAVLFAVTAFGDKFPPAYLKGNLATKYLAIGTLFLYLAAMFMGMRAAQPRNYKLYRHNLDGMRDELDRMIRNKTRSLWFAGTLFWLGSAVLVVLIVTLIMGA